LLRVLELAAVRLPLRRWRWLVLLRVRGLAAVRLRPGWRLAVQPLASARAAAWLLAASACRVLRWVARCLAVRLRAAWRCLALLPGLELVAARRPGRWCWPVRRRVRRLRLFRHGICGF